MVPTLKPRPSLCSHLLFTVIPAPYRHATLNDLLAALVSDLNDMSQQGITVSRL